jgi:membrane associated rhomboid family serine protease
VVFTVDPRFLRTPLGFTPTVSRFSINWTTGEYHGILGRLIPMRPRAPLFTLALVTACLLGYALELVDGGQVVCEAYGLVPAHFLRSGDLEPLLSSLFLHDPSGPYHLAGNMLFLVVFGALVEGAIGHLAFLGLYLAAGVGGGLLHVLVAPSAAIPLVGASGSIFGILAVAGILRPRLLGFVAAFASLNIYNAVTGGDEGVSFGAHLGGLFVGFLVVAALRAGGSEALEAA